MKTIKILMVALLLPVFALAWNGKGHMTGGAITYYYLKKNNPAVLLKVLSTLKQHRWYNYKIWQDRLRNLTAEQQDIALFMLASIYPDQARDSSGLGDGIKEQWHYINYPFVPVGQTVQSRPAKSPNAQQKINELINILPTQTDNQGRAIDVAWLFHLIQDVHQPLHTVALFHANHPNGDLGGNRTYIQLGTGSGTKLHSYWDSLIPGEFNTIPEKARLLLSKPMYSTTALTELTSQTTADDWIINESVELAETKAYLNGSINGKEFTSTPVNSAYKAKAKEIAERRIVLAGIRLAQTLIRIYR